MHILRWAGLGLLLVHCTVIGIDEVGLKKLNQMYGGQYPTSVTTSCYYWCRVDEKLMHESCVNICGKNSEITAVCYNFCRAEGGLHGNCQARCEN